MAISPHSEERADLRKIALTGVAEKRQCIEPSPATAWRGCQIGADAQIKPHRDEPQGAKGGNDDEHNSLKRAVRLRNLCLALTGARAAESDGAITADEALEGEDSRYAAQAKSDFEALGKLYGDHLVYVHSTRRR